MKRLTIFAFALAVILLAVVFANTTYFVPAMSYIETTNVAGFSVPIDIQGIDTTVLLAVDSVTQVSDRVLSKKGLAECYFVGIARPGIIPDGQVLVNVHTLNCKDKSGQMTKEVKLDGVATIDIDTTEKDMERGITGFVVDGRKPVKVFLSKDFEKEDLS